MSFINKFDIVIDKTPLESFTNLSLQQSVFGHHNLEITCRRDTFEDEGNFILDKSDKLLGGAISVAFSTEDNDKNEFEGIVTQVSASKYDGPNGGDIVIKAQSPDILLDDGEHCRSFEDKTPEKIIKQILKEYEFDTNHIKPKIAKESMSYTVQYKESAYDFITRIAIKKGEWFFYNGKDLVFGNLPSKKVDLKYGVDLFNFDFSLQTDDLKFKYLTRDYFNNELISKDSGKHKISNLSRKGKVAYDKSSKLYKHETLSLYNHQLSQSDPATHLDDRVKLIKGAQASGLVTCSGSSNNPNIILGCEIKITETYGESRERKTVEHGSYIVTNVVHSCDRTGNYQNSFTSIPKEIEVPPHTTPHAIPFCETQSAIVKDNNDPEGLGRIRVQFLWQDPNMSPWLRIVSPYAGSDKGFYFIPEIGEEVLVAFEGGNAEKPYVIGSLYHGKADPKSWVNEENDIKAIRTRSGHTIEFVDTDGSEVIKIYDYEKENYVITLSTHQKKITIESKGDIAMKAEGDFEIEAVGDLKVKANNIQMDANQDFKMQATNMVTKSSAKMEITAGSQLEQKASAGMKIDGGMKLEQKAAMMIINGGSLLEQKAGLITIN